MKRLLLLLPLTACITINQGGSQNNSPMARGAAPLALMATADTGDAAMAYSAGAVLAAYNPEKARTQTIAAAKAMEGEILQDGTHLVVVRIPSAQLTNYIEGLKKFGKLESFRIEGENLSRPIQDNSLRIESLEKNRIKYQSLLQQSAKMQDILAITREIEQIDSQLQYLNRQQQDSQQNIASSQVAVELKKRSGYGPIGWVLHLIWRGIRWFFWWG